MAALILGYVKGKHFPPYIFVIALALWVPFFLFYASTTLRIPLIHYLVTASGLASWVTEHRVWWEMLLATYFGFMAGGWLGAKLTTFGRSDHDL